MTHTCIKDDGGTPNRRCAACDDEAQRDARTWAGVVTLKSPAVPKGMEPQHSVDFIQGMLDRMGMSAWKYGDVREAYPQKLDAVGSALMRIARYLGAERFTAAAAAAVTALPASEAMPHRRANGNTEYLMDAANFCMIEHMLPRLEDAHFRATDSDESPGRLMASGKAAGQAANTTGRENVRRGGSNLRTDGGFYKQEGD